MYGPAVQTFTIMVWHSALLPSPSPSSPLPNIPCPCPLPQSTPTQVTPVPALSHPKRLLSHRKALITQLQSNHQQRQLHKAASTQTSSYERGGRSPAVQVHTLVGIYGDMEAITCLWKGEGGLALGVAAVHHYTRTVRI